MFLGVFVVLLVHSAVTKAQVSTISTAPFKRIMQQHDVAAGAIIVVDKDSVLLDAHLGVRDWESKNPFSAKDRYRIGSISKTFAGLLALRLQAVGKIKLTDDISDYGLKPYFKNNYPDQTITLAHLLEHTAGLADLNQAEWDFNKPEVISIKQAFDLKLGNHQTKWPPMHRSYSNVGAGLFGLALENQLGVAYENLMEQYVFEPLAMQHTNLLLTPDVKQYLITGYGYDGKTPIPYWHNIYRPFAGINTTNGDLIKWLQMWLQKDSKFLNQADKNRMGTPTTSLAAQHGLSYGYGLGLYQWQTEGHSFYGHGGDADGYLTRFGYNPESGLAYFVMINAFNHQPLKQMVAWLEQHIIAELPKPSYPLRMTVNKEVLHKLVGTYQKVTSRFGHKSNQSQGNLKLFTEKDQLYYRFNNEPKTALYQVKENLFRTVDDSVATMVFITHQNKLYFHGSVGNFVQVIDDK